MYLSAIWSGAKLADVLELVGISKFTSVTPAGGKHVEFVSVDKCKVCIHLFKGTLVLLTCLAIAIQYSPFPLPTGREWGSLQGINSINSSNKS